MGLERVDLKVWDAGAADLVVVPLCSWAEPVVRCCPLAMVVWTAWSLGCGVWWW